MPQMARRIWQVLRNESTPCPLAFSRETGTHGKPPTQPENQHRTCRHKCRRIPTTLLLSHDAVCLPADSGVLMVAAESVMASSKQSHLTKHACQRSLRNLLNFSCYAIGGKPSRMVFQSSADFTDRLRKSLQALLQIAAGGIGNRTIALQISGIKLLDVGEHC